jgi:hypothetical protein
MHSNIFVRLSFVHKHTINFTMVKTNTFLQLHRLFLSEPISRSQETTISPPDPHLFPPHIIETHIYSHTAQANTPHTPDPAPSAYAPRTLPSSTLPSSTLLSSTLLSSTLPSSTPQPSHRSNARVRGPPHIRTSPPLPPRHHSLVHSRPAPPGHRSAQRRRCARVCRRRILGKAPYLRRVC